MPNFIRIVNKGLEKIRVTDLGKPLFFPIHTSAPTTTAVPTTTLPVTTVAPTTTIAPTTTNSPTTTAEELGAEKITDWVNYVGGNALETFTSSGKDITSAINTGSSYGGCNTATAIPVTGGHTYKVVINLTVNSGTTPNFSIDYEPQVLINGENIIYYSPLVDSADAILQFWHETDAMNFSAVCSFKEVI